MTTRQISRTTEQARSGRAWRIFAAVPVSDAVREVLREAQSALSREAWLIKWVEPELAHLTVKFYGDVAVSSIPRLESLLSRVAEGASSAEVRATNFGAFPSLRHPRVIWLGLDGDLAHLDALATEVEQASQGFGKPEARPFNPHITLGRFRAGAPAPRDVEAALALLDATTSAVPFCVDRLQLIHSVLTPVGPAYTTIAEWPLGVPPEIHEHG
jgi:2'-5' RNA ligase